MIKILKAFNKIETQSRAVLRCKVTQEVHWVREGVLEIDFFIFLKQCYFYYQVKTALRGKPCKSGGMLKTAQSKRKKLVPHL